MFSPFDLLVSSFKLIRINLEGLEDLGDSSNFSLLKV